MFSDNFTMLSIFYSKIRILSKVIRGNFEYWVILNTFAESLLED